MTDNTTDTHENADSMYGLLAQFDDVDSLLQATEKVRDAGFTRWDTHTPFVVHGLDDAMGMKDTKLPLLVFACGLTGFVVGTVLQWWMNAVDYPFIISGKPFFGLPANIPIMFETTILFSALGTFIGMLAFNRLPEWYHPLFRSERFRQVTTDTFFISIQASDPCFDLAETTKLLEQAGAHAVEQVTEE